MADHKVTRSNPQEMSLLGHLDELRTRLIIGIGFFFFAVIACFFFADDTLNLLIRPVDRAVVDPEAPLPDRTPLPALELVIAADGSVSARDLSRLGDPENARVRLVVPPSGDTATTTTVLLTTHTPPRAKIIYDDILGPFMMRLKVSIVLGVLFSLLVWVWQIWLFVAPGLTENEKRVVKPMLAGSIFLFPLGAAFAYALFFFIIPVMQGYIVPGIDTLYNIEKYLKLMTTMMIVFGFIFELPLVVALLSRIGILTPALLAHYRRHIYVGLAVVAMIVTPADPISMLVAYVPLLVLFELSVWLSRPMSLLWSRDAEAREAEEREEEETRKRDPAEAAPPDPPNRTED